MKTSILVKKKKKNQQCDKKDEQASCDILCKFCSKKHEFGKNLCPAWGKECKLCKTKNHFKGSLVWKESKNQKGSKKNNSTNFTENNDYKSDQSLFTVTQYVNQVDKPGQPITLNFKLYGPFLWMGFNCLKASATSRRQFTFYH